MIKFLTTAIVLASAAVHLVAGQTLATVYTKCTANNKVAITFDDGPYSYLTDIVNTLDAAGAKATFFFNGKNWGCIYDQSFRTKVKYAYDHGHQVASHTWAHKDLTTLTWDQIHDEMWKVELALKRITGAVPAMMRPPYGNYNNLVRQASAVRGQSLIMWDLDSGDSTGASLAAQKSAYDNRINALKNTSPKNILALNHETSYTTAYQLLPYIIQKLQAAGYQLVTVAECLGKPAYQSTGPPEAYNSATWKC